MIPFEFSFLRAESVDDLAQAWNAGVRAGKTVRYFGGGTEIVTLARENKQPVDVLVDYKHVPEAQVFGVEPGGGSFAFGAGLRLNTLVDTEGSGLLGLCARGVGDRTVRNSITLGGNVCGMLPYREAVLPFLLLDARVRIAVPAKESPIVEERPIAELFSRRMKLPEGGVVLAFLVDGMELKAMGFPTENVDHSRDVRDAKGGVDAAGAGRFGVSATDPARRWFYARHTRDPQVDYPLTTVAIANLESGIRVAVSGAWGYPHRAVAAEAVINGALPPAGSSPTPTRSEGFRALVEEAVSAEGLKFRDDMRGGGAYRRELTVRAIAEGLAALRGEKR